MFRLHRLALFKSEISHLSSVHLFIWATRPGEAWQGKFILDWFALPAFASTAQLATPLLGTWHFLIEVEYRCSKDSAVWVVKGTLPETNISPENGWLEDDRFLLGPGLFSGVNSLLVSGRVTHNVRIGWYLTPPRLISNSSKVVCCTIWKGVVQR